MTSSSSSNSVVGKEGLASCSTPMWPINQSCLMTMARIQQIRSASTKYASSAKKARAYTFRSRIKSRINQRFKEVIVARMKTNWNRMTQSRCSSGRSRQRAVLLKKQVSSCDRAPLPNLSPSSSGSRRLERRSYSSCQRLMRIHKVVPLTKMTRRSCVRFATQTSS